MIVISGALVLVALVLLVLGVTQSDINLVYGCIVVSLVSLVFLVLGIVQRRGEVLPGAAKPAEPTPGSAAPAPTSISSAPVDSDDLDSDPGESLDLDPDDDLDDAQPHHAQPHHGQPHHDQPHHDLAAIAAGGADRPASAVAGTVLVVANRPRYHVDGCRYLAGKQAQEVDVVDARKAGFTACGVCKPPADPADAPAVVPAAGSAVAPAAATQAEPGVQPSAVGGPAPAAGEVVVIPDRNRYHRADCRHVRGAAGVETLESLQARKQGYSACGVCKP